MSVLLNVLQAWCEMGDRLDDSHRPECCVCRVTFSAYASHYDQSAPGPASLPIPPQNEPPGYVKGCSRYHIVKHVVCGSRYLEIVRLLRTPGSLGGPRRWSGSHSSPDGSCSSSRFFTLSLYHGLLAKLFLAKKSLRRIESFVITIGSVGLVQGRRVRGPPQSPPPWRCGRGFPAPHVLAPDFCASGTSGSRHGPPWCAKSQSASAYWAACSPLEAAGKRSGRLRAPSIASGKSRSRPPAAAFRRAAAPRTTRACPAAPKARGFCADLRACWQGPRSREQAPGARAARDTRDALAVFAPRT